MLFMNDKFWFGYCRFNFVAEKKIVYLFVLVIYRNFYLRGTVR